MEQIPSALPAGVTTFPHPSSKWTLDRNQVMAITLHQLTGWPIATLHDRRPGGSGAMTKPIHSGVWHPAGHFVDADGVHTQAGMIEVARRYMPRPEISARWEACYGWRDLMAEIPEAPTEVAVLLAEAALHARQWLAGILPTVPPTNDNDEMPDRYEAIATLAFDADGPADAVHRFFDAIQSDEPVRVQVLDTEAKEDPLLVVVGQGLPRSVGRYVVSCSFTYGGAGRVGAAHALVGSLASHSGWDCGVQDTLTSRFYSVDGETLDVEERTPSDS